MGHCSTRECVCDSRHLAGTKSPERGQLLDRFACSGGSDGRLFSHASWSSVRGRTDNVAYLHGCICLFVLCFWNAFKSPLNVVCIDKRFLSFVILGWFTLPIFRALLNMV
ncbi:hypothetical protein C0J52_08829 [Blattella germanica]|nr:hypothetical protein C0J52_08829 [Blattella germanica]